MNEIFAPIRQKKISEEIADQLKSLIFEGKLKPGQRLPPERELAKSLGVSDGRIVFRHLIPNVLSPVIVIVTLSIPGVILAEAALSFIGLGDPTVTSWGVVLQAGQRSLDTTWWVAIEPGILLFLTVLAFNFLGDGLRDAFDPRSQF